MSLKTSKQKRGKQLHLHDFNQIETNWGHEIK